jgi:hypothetical protein
MKTFAAALTALALFAPPALAHHSGVMFDRSKETVLDGTVTGFGWTNPHGWIRMTVADASGTPKEWTIEAGSPGSLSRSGWTKTTLKPGDHIVLKIFPLKSGGPGGVFKEVATDDGRVFGSRAGAE